MRRKRYSLIRQGVLLCFIMNGTPAKFGGGHELNAVKFFALISVFSLALGAAAAIVYAGYKYVTEPEKKETSVTQVSKPNPEPEENNQETEEQAENTNPPSESTQTPNTQPQKLSAEDAVRIAKEKAGDGYLKKVEYKEEKGLAFYKVELTSGKRKYNLEISAYSGEIIKAEVH
jgi:uncharacterized membrane protein YkoI